MLVKILKFLGEFISYFVSIFFVIFACFGSMVLSIKYYILFSNGSNDNILLDTAIINDVKYSSISNYFKILLEDININEDDINIISSGDKTKKYLSEIQSIYNKYYLSDAAYPIITDEKWNAAIKDIVSDTSVTDEQSTLILNKSYEFRESFSSNFKSKELMIEENHWYSIVFKIMEFSFLQYLLVIIVYLTIIFLLTWEYYLPFKHLGVTLVIVSINILIIICNFKSENNLELVFLGAVFLFNLIVAICSLIANDLIRKKSNINIP